MLPTLLRTRAAAHPGGLLLQPAAQTGSLILRRALMSRTIDIKPRDVTEGERPIIVPPPPGEQASSGNSSAETTGPSSSASTEGKGWGLFPDDIVSHLDRYVVGQEEAKKATAIALRSRWRRSQVAEDIRAEIAPTNMLFKVRWIWLTGWLAGWLANWLTGWLIGWII